MRCSARGKIAPEKIAACVEVMHSNVLNGDIPLRRAYIRSVIDRVDVDDAEIRIFGQKTVLERLEWVDGMLRRECPVWFGSGAPDRMNCYVIVVSRDSRSKESATAGAWRRKSS